VRALLLRLEPGTVVPRHRHLGEPFRGVMGIAPRGIVRAAQRCRAFFLA
jgi:hypothetical protein